jgi:hypothetical protein
VKRKGLGRDSSLIKVITPALTRIGENNGKISVWIIEDPARILGRHVLNTSLECYSYITLLHTAT